MPYFLKLQFNVSNLHLYAKYDRIEIHIHYMQFQTLKSMPQVF